MDWNGSEFAFQMDADKLGPDVADQIELMGGAHVEFTITDPESGDSHALGVYIEGDNIREWVNNYYDIVRELVEEVLIDSDGGSFDGAISITGISL